MVQRDEMPAIPVQTAGATYSIIVENGVLARAGDYLPARVSRVFLVTNEAVWAQHRNALDPRLAAHAHVLFLPPGEVNKRLSCVETLAAQMVEAGADRSSAVVGFGGGIVTDVSGFLAAIFMRGVPVLQIPTTLLAQVDAAIGGKTGVNLEVGKNLIGSFHQPVAVLSDPAVLRTLPRREYLAGLYEVIKCAVIRSAAMFTRLGLHSDEVLAMKADAVEYVITSAAQIKAEVVSADERENGLRRILNFGHTVGHAIEAETRYQRFLHGEAIGWGMLIAVRLAELTGHLREDDAGAIRELIHIYGPLPDACGLSTENLLGRLASDKKTLAGKVHFVLPVRIGEVTVVSGIDSDLVSRAIAETLQ